MKRMAERAARPRTEAWPQESLVIFQGTASTERRVGLEEKQRRQRKDRGGELRVTERAGLWEWSFF